MAQAQKSTMLLIEDDPQTRQVIFQVLTTANWEVVAAGSAEEAFELLKTIKPKLILLDLLLPQIDGWKILYTIRDELKRSEPIIIFSHLGSDKDIHRALALGATEYLVKSHTSSKALQEKLEKYR
jgi:DNA-binding response OmpR family regulator